jgi:hypothetical protein
MNINTIYFLIVFLNGISNKITWSDNQKQTHPKNYHKMFCNATDKMVWHNHRKQDFLAGPSGMSLIPKSSLSNIPIKDVVFGINFDSYKI